MYVCVRLWHFAIFPRMAPKASTPSATAAAASSGGNDGAAPKPLSPLEHYMSYIKKHLPMYTVADLSATSAPLPERRPRVWIVGSRCDDFKAASWAALAVHLENVCVAKPRHHMDHLLVPKAPNVRPAAATKSKEDAGRQWAKDAAYHKHFSEGLQKALDAKRLPEDTVPPDMGKRPSRRPENNQMTAAQAGSLDVYSMIIAAAQDTGDTKYADITQATHRGQVVLHGVVKTLATSTRLYDLKTFSYIKPERHLAILGYGPDLKLDLVTEAELYEMSGNAMSLAGLCKVMSPLLAHLDLCK